jgi:hypothetical protein
VNTQVTLTLPEDVFQRAEQWAQRTGRPVADFLAETLELTLQPLGSPIGFGEPLTSWSDDEVLAAVDAQLDPADDERLSILLDNQQAGSLATAELAVLSDLMHLYQAGLLRKAQALREAVRRGLRPPLQP